MSRFAQETVEMSAGRRRGRSGRARPCWRVVAGAAVSVAALGFGSGSAVAARALGQCVPRDAAHLAYVSDMGAGTVSVIDTRTQQVIDVIHGFENPWHSTLSPNGSLLYVDNAPITNLLAGGEEVVNLCTRQIVERIAPAGIGQVWSTESIDHRQLYVTTLNNPTGKGSLKIVDPNTATVENTINGPPLTALNVQSCNGSTLWIAQLPDTIQAITPTGKPLSSPILLPGVPQVVVMTPDCRKLVALDLDGAVSIIDIATRTVRSVDIGDHYLGAYAGLGAAAPDSKTFWAGSYEGGLTEIDLRTATIIHQMHIGGFIVGVRVTPDNQHVIVSGSAPYPPGLAPIPIAESLTFPNLLPGPGLIRTYDTSSYEQTGQITTGIAPTTIDLPNPPAPPARTPKSTRTPPHRSAARRHRCGAPVRVVG